MNHAKFCPATQGWSTPEWVNPFLLLRRRSLAKQEQDHGHESRAMPLRDWPFFEVCGGAEGDGNPSIKRKRPGDPGAPPSCNSLEASGCCFGVNHPSFGLAVADRNLARFLCLGDFAYEIDVQKSVLEARVLDQDVIGKLEDALESARGDALIEDLTTLFFLGLLRALDRQRVFFRLDGKLVFAEAGDRDGDAVVVLTGTLDVVRRVTRSGLKSVQH